MSLVAGAVAVALVVATAGALMVSRGDEVPRDPGSGPAAGTERRDTVTTTLLFGTYEDVRSGQGAVWLTLLAHDDESGEAAVVYIPAHTAVEVPGRGLQALGNALASGGIPLLVGSTETFLGVELDRYLEISDKDARVLFEATGPLSVDVPEEVRVPAGKDQARLLFAEGRQRLPAHFLVRLLYTVGIEEDDVELGSRHLAFWAALFEHFQDDPDALSAAIHDAAAALAESDAPAAAHGRFVGALAALPGTARTLASLPVTQVSVGASELYEANSAEIERFVAQTVGASAVRRDEVAVQLLNGNGAPGIGEEAAELLRGQGFRVTLSGNARNFGYQQTLIITYDTSAAGQAVARRAKELLGVGEVQVSAQQQGIVDLTIVLGKDFLRAR